MAARQQPEQTLTEQGTTRPFLIVQGTDVTGQKHPNNYFITIMHCIKGLIGTGIYAMGSAFSSSGMLLGPVSAVFVWFLSLHCQHILIKACVKITDKELVEVLPSFAETVEYTMEDSSSNWIKKLSRGSGIVTDVFLLIAQYGYCVVYLVFVSRHIGEIAAAHGWEQNYRVILVIVLIPMWISALLGNLKLLLPFSMIANIVMWIGIVCILYYSVQDLPDISERDLVSHAERLPVFFGIILFAFAGITFIIPVRSEMKNPESFTKLFGELNMAMFVALIFSVLVGILAFWKWGDDVEGSAFLNLPQEDVLAQVTKILISISVMFTYTLHMYVPFEILYPRFNRRFGPFKYPVLAMYLYRSAAVLMTYAMANISSNIALFIALVGAGAGAVLNLLFPALLDLAMGYGELTVVVIIKDVFIIILAFAGGITGTVLSIIDIINEFE
ncbi:proton-coupled amino acid transporter-like protein CG1139 [Zophobas morio]|uniref:proton-coupled amino acid transporter-like protein CG1139 n=1 Tax=Zophobas morio TaxID=2755281 RepID=UPI0030829B15